MNAVTRKDTYPLPRVDYTLDTVGDKWFSTLELISGYWQVERSPDNQEKTALCTTDGLFEFKVMPFGLCNPRATTDGHGSNRVAVDKLLGLFG